MSKAEDDVEQQHPLLSEVGDDQRQVSPVRKALGSHIITMSSFVSGTVFAVFLFAIFNRTRGPQSELEIYSPVQHLLDYRPTNLLDDLFDRSPYMTNVNGLPDETTDARWKALYDKKMHSQISASEAEKLDSTTLNIPNKPNRFLIQLDLYHQLHCLNAIRKALWLPGVERYKKDFHNFVTEDGGRNYTGSNAQHIDHCLDWIRQALLCQPDITPVTWQIKTVKEGDIPLPILPLRKNCRNMDAINGWAQEHEVAVDFGSGVEGDP